MGTYTKSLNSTLLQFKFCSTDTKSLKITLVIKSLMNIQRQRWTGKLRGFWQDKGGPDT